MSALPNWLNDAIAALVEKAYEAGRKDRDAEAVHDGQSQRETMLTRQEAAAELRVSVPTVNRLIAAGSLRSTKVGARRFIPAESLDAYRSAGAS